MVANTLQLQINSHRFKVAVEEADKPRMLAAARQVQELLDVVRSNNKVADGERAALMVALQIAASHAVLEQDILAQIDTALDDADAALDGALAAAESHAT